jgi:hypothetical protein
MAEEAEVEVEQVSVDIGQAKARAQADLNFFSGLCIPDVMQYRFPLYYIALWTLLVRALEDRNKVAVRRVLRYVIGLPRGFCKTTFIKCLIAWLICHGYVRFVLIICATDPLAEAFLSDLHSILQSLNIEALYGKWDPATDSVHTKKGIHQREILIIKARGSGTAVRGINEDNRRPDMIVCDDMQTKENDSSDTDRKNLDNWFFGTLLKTVTQKQSIVLYVGNMYSDHCILYQLKVNPFWTSLITGCILNDGSSLWPELFSIADLYQDFLHDEAAGKADIWFAEMMNDPVESIDGLIQGPFPDFRVPLIAVPDAAFLTVDPAGYRKQADDNVICAHHIINGKGAIMGMRGGIWNPKETVEKGLEDAIKYNAPHIFVEAVAYQASLAFWFNHFIASELVKGISAVPLKRPTNKTKTQFIRNFLQEIYANNYGFADTEARQKFVWQATAYRISRQQNKDDWLDAPAMGVEVRNQHGRMLTVRRSLAHVQRAQVQPNNTPF